jgi:hypothetical protein
VGKEHWSDLEMLEAIDAARGDLREAASRLGTTYGCLKRLLTRRELWDFAVDAKAKWKARYRIRP